MSLRNKTCGFKIACRVYESNLWYCIGIKFEVLKDFICALGIAFGAHCEITDQCYSVIDAICGEDDDETVGVKRCRCPVGQYFNGNGLGQCLHSIEILFENLK